MSFRAESCSAGAGDFVLQTNFEFNKLGKRNKTCQRHTKKRSLDVDDWGAFILRLQNWNKPVTHFVWI